MLCIADQIAAGPAPAGSPLVVFLLTDAGEPQLYRQAQPTPTHRDLPHSN